MKQRQVCDNVSDLFLMSGKTVKVFADSVGVAAGAAGNWVSRKCNPNSARIPAIADFFGVPISRLFEGVE